MKSDCSHLCNPSVLFTSELFGDVVSKTAKELEDFARMGYRIQHNSARGFGIGRTPFRGRLFRGLGFRSRGFLQGIVAKQKTSVANPEERTDSRTSNFDFTISVDF
ncbi:hypothetical protein DPMN_099397 [Dreissena polymorpha]|uniref:Uncharacterized protein n=1 Tax=Dreissena polymorpha TaxID=45954 RepID=A0A9D4R7L6_DREPO|nr:hypothetical protein DPMN_099397 [Dreissena polymorpha]